MKYQPLSIYRVNELGTVIVIEDVDEILTIGDIP